MLPIDPALQTEEQYFITALSGRSIFSINKCLEIGVKRGRDS